MRKERVLGKDYIILKGRGERDIYNGATIEGDTKFMHFGYGLKRETACGRLIKEFLLAYSDIEINCPKCIKVFIPKS